MQYATQFWVQNGELKETARGCTSGLYYVHAENGAAWVGPGSDRVGGFTPRYGTLVGTMRNYQPEVDGPLFFDPARTKVARLTIEIVPIED